MHAASVLEEQFSWTHFAWDSTEPIATRPLFTQRGTGYKFFYTCDGNKNVSEMVHFERRNGIAAHYDYAPFGAVTRAISVSAVTDNTFTTDNPFRCSSEYHDDTLGLVYYRERERTFHGHYRHYNPIDGRWCGRDLLESCLNLHLYCNNFAVVNYDVLGLIAIEIEVNPVINYEEVDINFLREMSSGFSALAAMTFNIEFQNMEINYNEICKTCEVEALEVKASFTIFHLKRGQVVTVYNRNLQKEQTGYVSEQFIKDSIEHEKKHVQFYMNASQGCTVQIPVMYNV